MVREQLLVKIGEGRDEVTWDERVEWEGWGVFLMYDICCMNQEIAFDSKVRAVIAN